MTTPFTPYSTGATLFGQKPSWIGDPLDQARVQSYELYDKIYWNLDDTFVLAVRGTNDRPLYVPSARTIVDTSNRFTGAGYAVSVIDALGRGETPSVIAARMALDDLMARERFLSKFAGAKRYCQIQGDWVWHITANPNKTLGSRLSMNVVDPGYYFPVFDPDNLNRIIAVFLAEPFQQGDTLLVRRVCYRKVESETGGPTQITVEEGLFPPDAWQDLDAQPSQVTRAVEALPETITAIPVYHIKNTEESRNPFGSSELRGFEGLIRGLTQVMSDEDLTLAMQGLGMYTTDAPQPVNPETKRPVAWQLGPGQVVHTPDGKAFKRVDGVGSVTPYGDHYDRIFEALKMASASPDVAVGTVDVQIAQSGIALSLQLLPIRAKAAEKNTLIAEAHDQMWYDIINGWYPAYEETEFTEVDVQSVFGDAVPVDRQSRFAELNDMIDRFVIDDAYYRAEVAKLGYEFPTDMNARASAFRALQQAAADPFADRAATELTDGAE
jgi:hypothetical protein